MITGYTTGVFDLFHIGHLNILRGARGLCDRLIVGVNTDELVLKTKGRPCVIPFADRIEIVRSNRNVDIAIPQKDPDKYAAWQRLRYDVLVIGDDWYGDQRWTEYVSQLGEHGVKTVYLPHTDMVRSSTLRQMLSPT